LMRCNSTAKRISFDQLKLVVWFEAPSVWAFDGPQYVI